MSFTLLVVFSVVKVVQQPFVTEYTLFYVSYILVKDDICEYNVKEVILLGARIQDFRYPELKEDLEGILKNLKQ